MTVLRDELGHFKTRQLTTFTRLSALRDFNFHFAAIVEVFRGDAEPARCNLLHRRIHIVAIRQRTVALAHLAAFPRNRLRTDPVHRDVESAMCFRAEGAERHTRRHETFADFVDGLHTLQRLLRACRFEIKQVAKLDRLIALLNDVRILLEKVVIAAITRRLQHVNGVSVQRVRL